MGKKMKVKTKGKESCVLLIDGKYFGYDNHPQYPETLFKKRSNAYIFRDSQDAMSVVSWYPGEVFKIIPHE